MNETFVSLAILAGSYVAARLLSFLFGKLLTRHAAGTASSLDDRLVAAIERPLTYALFLSGAYVAVRRLSFQQGWADRVDDALFVFGALLMTLALLRAYGILVGWYTAQAKEGGGDRLAAEFGPLASKLGKTLIGVLSLMVVLQHLGINVASLVVSLGVGSLAVGLAAQDTLANIFAGLTLMLDRPFRIGDRVQLATGEVGDVEGIGMRSTRIRTLDETLLFVPNAVLVKDRLVNQTRPGRHITTRVDVGVAYGTDLAQAKRVLREAAAAAPKVDPALAPIVVVTRFAEYAVTLRVVFWARDYTEQALAASEVHEEIDRRFREAGIEIPFPTRRVIQEDGAAEERTA